MESLWMLSGFFALVNFLLGRSALARTLWRIVRNMGRSFDRSRTAHRANASSLFVVDEWVLAMMAPLILYALLWLLADVAPSSDIQMTRQAWDATRSNDTDRQTVVSR